MRNINILRQEATDNSSTTFLAKVYGLMCLSLILSFVTAYVTAISGVASRILSSGNGFAVAIGIMIGEFIMVWLISKHAVKHPQMAMTGLVLFSVVDGMTLSVIFYAYSMKLIADAFLIASVDFGCMSYVGLKTKRNLTWGRQLFGATIALIIVDIIQMFWFNSLAAIIFASIGVLVFSLWTIYDSQKVMQFGRQTGYSLGVVVTGALNLYLDFINLFLDILQIIGGNSRN